MNLKTELLREHSKPQTMKIVAYIGSDQSRFGELIVLVLGEDSKIAQRAAWTMSHCLETSPNLIIPHLKVLLENLRNPVHDAIKRNTIRALDLIEIPEDLLGLVADICFEFLDSTKESIAIRVFSMTALFKVCQQEPELSSELKIIIEDHYPHGSAGFKSRARRILKGIAKLQKEME